MTRLNGDNPSDESEINKDDETCYNPKRELITQNYDEPSSKNIVSTIAEKQFQKFDKSFSWQKGLYNHKKSSHEGVKYPCSECSHKATRKDSLQAHVAAIHEGVKYPCTECNYKATQKGSLKVQMASVHKK